MAKKKYDEKPVREGGGTTTAEEVDANGTPMSMPKGEDPAEGGLFDKLSESSQDMIDDVDERIAEAEKRRKRRTIFDVARGNEPKRGRQVLESRITAYPQGGEKGEPVSVMSERLTRRPQREDPERDGHPVSVIQDEMTRRPIGENEGREPAPEMRFEREVTSRPIGENGGNENKRRSIFDLAREARQ